MMKPKPLPDDIRKYIREERCVSDEVIDKMQLGWYSSTKQYPDPWIVIPTFDRNGKITDCCRKRPPNSNHPCKTQNKKGSKAALYGQHLLGGESKHIIITEGQWSVLALMSAGFTAVCSTCGAKHFREKMLEPFPQGAKVTLLFDKDNAGNEAIYQLTRTISKHRPDIKMYILWWTDNFEEKADATRLALWCRENEKELSETVIGMSRPFEEDRVGNQRFPRTPSPDAWMVHHQWKAVIEKHFPDLFFATEVCASVLAQLLIEDITNPFALVLVDVPSAGKTIVINFFASADLSELTYSTDKFSPSSFVSNAANVKRENLAEVDLLPRIQHKVLCLRDLAPIFSLREEDLTTNVGILTRVLDGEGLSTDMGVHGRRSVTGDYLFMLLAATTPIRNRVWRVMSMLGPRLFFLHLHNPTKTSDQLISQLQNNPCRQREKECRVATKNFIRTLWSHYSDGIVWDKEEDEEKHLRVIAICAQLLSFLRANIHEESESNEDGKPITYRRQVAEKPDRINQLLYNLARGHAIVQNRTKITDDDMQCVITLAWDAAPGNRAELFQALLKTEGSMNTSDVQKALNCSTPTALHEMKQMTLLGICEECDDGDLSPQKRIRLRGEFMWFCSEECKNYMKNLPTESDLPNPPNLKQI